MGARLRSESCLKDLWLSLFDESNIKSDEPDNDYQGLLMLLETSLHKSRSFSSNYKSLKTTNQNLLSELECKTEECNTLKKEVLRLETIPCRYCSLLEEKVLKYKKKANEAQNRMISIANILKLGENIQDSQSPRKNSAYTLVSQMLLDESPKRKKRCLINNSPNLVQCPTPEIISSSEACGLSVYQELPLSSYNRKEAIPKKQEVILGEDDETIIPESLPQFESPGIHKNLNISNETSIITPRSRIQSNSICSNNLLNSNRGSQLAKKNLTSDFDESFADLESVSKTTGELQDNTSADLSVSLAKYVKDASYELDKIWFSGTNSTKSNENTKDKSIISDREDCILEKTPESPQRKNVWKLKEKRGAAEKSGRKRLKQMQLSLARKARVKDVDISTLSGYDGGSIEPGSSKKDEKSNCSFKSPLKVRNPFEEDVDTIENCNTSVFNPQVTSTQVRDVHKERSKNDEPNFKYKRDAVRKKSERAKLEGWDCTNCAEYYTALGVTSPSKVKDRMNKCSRHRDRFKPTTNTPPGYWNPIFPDSEECRKKRFYVSVNVPSDN